MFVCYLFAGLLYGSYFYIIAGKNKAKKYHAFLAWFLCLPYIVVIAFWLLGFGLFGKLNEPL